MFYRNRIIKTIIVFVTPIFVNTSDATVCVILGKGIVLLFI